MRGDVRCWINARYVAGLFMLRDFIRAILFVRCFPRNTLPRLNFLSHPELNIFHIIPVIEKK